MMATPPRNPRRPVIITATPITPTADHPTAQARRIRARRAAGLGQRGTPPAKIMRRISVQPRADWQAIVEAQGFHFHSPEDQPYWDESVCYLFSRAQVDQLEGATYALNNLCLAAIPHIIEKVFFDHFQIPPQFVPWIVESWKRDEITIYGRFDLAYDGRNPPKLLEYN